MYTENFSLQTYNTFGLNVRTQAFFQFNDIQECICFLQKGTYPHPLFVLGGGSNVLFTDNFKGTIIHPHNKGIRIISEDTDTAYVLVAGGEEWDDFVAWSVEHNLYGVENLSLIPGSVGASAVQNIGAYGVEAKDTIDTVYAIDTQNGKIEKFSNADCEFAYRSSVFKKSNKTYCISNIIFALSKKKHFTLEYGNIQETLEKNEEITLFDIRQTIISIRNTKLPDPIIIGNAAVFLKTQ
ncbi:MAG: FAD-binding protein [Bacteroidales bacterium]